MDDTEWLRKPETVEEFWEYTEMSYEHELIKDVVEMLNEMELPPEMDREDFYKEWERRFSIHLRQ